MNETKERVLAVDGDTLAYRTAAVCETHFEGAAYAIIKSTLKDIVAETQITKLRIYLSGSNNFRYEIGKTKPYKGNRATMVKPRFLPAVREHLVNEYKALVVDGFEADDAIATDMVKNGAIHCGVDKDILQVPGSHYNYVKKEWIHVNEGDAILTLYRQILMGDASDNVPGLPRVGEKKAFDSIQCVETAEEDALRMYEQVVRMSLPGVDYKEYFAEQSALVTMRTDVPLLFIKPTEMPVKTLELPLDTAGFVGQDSTSELLATGTTHNLVNTNEEGEVAFTHVPKKSIKL